MIYIILDRENLNDPMIVKCDRLLDIYRCLTLNKSYKIVAEFTNAEMDCLSVSSFVMLMGKAVEVDINDD